MAICSRCGKEFDLDFDRDIFETETLKSYDYLTQILCADCAIDAIEAEDGDAYFEVCERCGKRFNPFLAEYQFQYEHSDDAGASLDLFNELLCLDCANDAYEKIPKAEDFE